MPSQIFQIPKSPKLLWGSLHFWSGLFVGWRTLPSMRFHAVATMCLTYGTRMPYTIISGVKKRDEWIDLGSHSQKHLGVLDNEG